MRRWASAWWTSLGVLLATTALGRASEAAPLIRSRYNEQVLTVDLGSPPGEGVDLRWRSHLPGGPGKWRSAHFRPDQAALDLEVGLEDTHEITLAVGGEPRRLKTSRGTWFSLPHEAELLQRADASDESLIEPDDVILASGAAARVKTGALALELGRTFGEERGRGLPIHQDRSLVLIARGTGAAVRLTVAVRVGPERMAYFDYPLTLSRALRRYVIPLRRFLIREGQAPALEYLHSFALRSLSPAKSGDELAVDFVGLTKSGVQIREVGRTKEGARIRLTGAGTHDPVVVVRADERGTTPPAGGRKREHAGAPRYFVCWGRLAKDPPRATCDPPDAPLTSYQAPPKRGELWILDEPTGPTPVDAFRAPIVPVAADPFRQGDLSIEREQGQVRLRFDPRAAGGTATASQAYGGYVLALPKGVDTLDAWGSMEIVLRGPTLPRAINLGLRGANGRESHVNLAHYLERLDPNEWRTARVPLEAFRAQETQIAAKSKLRPKAISLTMTYGGTAAEEVSIRRLALTATIAPLVISRFDVDPMLLTAFGGRIAEEHAGGATVELLTPPSGGGRALQVVVKGVYERSYGLVLLGLGRIDASSHRALRFRVRGARGQEVARIGLSDRRHKALVNLQDFVEVSTQWQDVRIPLEAFGKEVKRDQLFHLLLLWSEDKIPEQRMLFDDFVLD